LPKDLATLLQQAAAGDEAPAIQALSRCRPDATGGYDKGTVLTQRGCTPGIARWAVARGTDVDAGGTYGRTALMHVAGRQSPSLGIQDLVDLGARLDLTCKAGRTAMHYAADAQNLQAVRELLALGLDPDAPSRDGTPLEHALQRVSNVGLVRMVPVAEALLAAGAVATETARQHVRRAAETFEFHRAGFNADLVEETAQAAEALCRLFDVESPAPRRMHDGVAPIVASPGRWQDQHEELWQLLVPSHGACATVQGEVVRITGRVSGELYRNGGGNWDQGYRDMVTALLGHLASGSALPAADLEEARGIASRLLRDMNSAGRLAELAVAWVAANPGPTPLPPPIYAR
ncbi:MAG: ankyrin repeat domain-containing protein, partial [Alphaproteobacteria bacterium]|nr:ankyrin repeat domain-containing protein [Alphaproteobacteria bacterium]